MSNSNVDGGLDCQECVYDPLVPYNTFSRATAGALSSATLGTQQETVSGSGGNGYTEDFDVTFSALGGGVCPAKVTLSQINNTGNAALNYLPASAAWQTNSNAGDMDLFIEFEDVVQVAIYPNSIIANGEDIFIYEDHPVVAQDRGTGSVNLTLPTTGALTQWHNTNNNALSGLLFAPSKTFRIRKNGTTAAGGSFRLVIIEGPSVVDVDICERLEEHGDAIDVLTADLAEAVIPTTVAITPTGLFRIGQDVPDVPIDIANTTITTGYDFTQTGIEDMILKIYYADATIQRGWDAQELNVGQLLIRAAAGDTIDGFNHVFDNDYVTVNLGDLATGEIILVDVGREMSYLRSELLAFVDLQNGIPIESEIAQIERYVTAVATITQQNINAAGTLDIAEERSGDGWSIANNEIEYSGQAESIEIKFHVNSAIPDTANTQRAAPILQLQLLVGADWIAVATSATGYVRDFSDHEQASHTAFFEHVNPPANPKYRIATDTDTTVTAAVNTVLGQVKATATLLMDVLVPVVPVAPVDGTTPTLPAAGGKVVSDNFQDQFGSLNLQVRNTTNASVDWQALIEDKAYSSISATGSFNIVTGDNGDGTFSHLFTGTSPLAAFANITIVAPSIAPAGDGTGLSLYCEPS